MRALQINLRQGLRCKFGNYSELVTLTHSSQQELKWWYNNVRNYKSTPINKVLTTGSIDANRRIPPRLGSSDDESPSANYDRELVHLREGPTHKSTGDVSHRTFFNSVFPSFIDTLSRSRGDRCLFTELAHRGQMRSPFNLIGRTLTMVRRQGLTLILVIPRWPSQIWYQPYCPS